MYLRIKFGAGPFAAQSQSVFLLEVSLTHFVFHTGFPWVAGQIVNEGVSEGNSGVFRVVPFQKLPQLVVKDLTNDESAPTMEGLKKARYPFSMLDEDLLCPIKTFAPEVREGSTVPTPVLILQANFIRGGLLLTINAVHRTVDITGQVHMISLLSKACRNEPFTNEEVTNGNLDRRNIIPLLDEDWDADAQPSVVTTSTSPAAPAKKSASPTPVRCAWACFSFSSASVAQLKTNATSTASSSSTFVSSDDALCAMIWQAIARAKLARLDPATESVFTRIVEIRRFMGIPKEFPGNIVTQTMNNSTLQEVTSQTIGDVASQLRSKLDPESLKHTFQANATRQARMQDKAVKHAGPDRSNYIGISSWTKADCYDFDFNLGLGKPEAVRRPKFTPFVGTVYLSPKAPDGEIVAGMCLREDEMESLRVDEEFLKYGEYIG